MTHSVEMLTMRPATMGDAEMLFAWRNDPGTRRMCRETHEVQWAGHVRWLGGCLADGDRVLTVFEQDGTAVGTCRVDRHRTGVELSITVSPEFRRSHLASDMMRMAMPEEDVWGYIRQENLVAQRAVMVLGFQMLSDGPLQVWLRPKPQSQSAAA